MTDEIANPCISNDLPRCQHRTPTGRRCRLAASDSDTGLCSKHLHPRPSCREDGDLSPILLGDITQLDTATDINQVLSNLFCALVQDRIAARRAAVLAYIGNLLLHSLPAVREEHPQQIIFDLPRPKRD